MSSSVPTTPIDYKALVQDDRIHASLYTDPRIFDDERERIFHRGWVFVGHDSEIPRPGDFVTRHVGTEPVIMVRGKDDAVSVLVNRCMHRGTMVCSADRGNARTFTCPYHGWTYEISGELLGVPYPGGYRAHDASSPPRRRRAEDVSQDGRAGERGRAAAEPVVFDLNFIGGANRRSPRWPPTGSIEQDCAGEARARTASAGNATVADRGADRALRGGARSRGGPYASDDRFADPDG